MFIIVDLPDPDGPMIATSSPSWMSRSTPRRACTVTSPIVYALVIPRRLSIVGCPALPAARLGREVAATATRATAATRNAATARADRRRAGARYDRGLALRDAADDLGLLVVGHADLNRSKLGAG